MAVLATDNFDRADNADLGTNWDVLTGESAYQIVSNTARPSNLAVNCAESYNAVAWPNDQYSQCTVTVVGTNGSTGPGPAVRMSTSAETGYFLFICRNAGATVNLYRAVAGTFTPIWQRLVTIADGDTFRLEVQGTTLRGFQNGVQIGADATDANIGSGRAGISYSSISTSCLVDLWVGGDFSVTPSASQSGGGQTLFRPRLWTY